MAFIGCGDPQKEKCHENVDQLRGKSNIYFAIARTCSDV